MRWAVVVVGVAVAGCSHSSTGGRDARLEQTVLAEASSGFVADRAASGPLDRAAAAAVGPQDPVTGRRLLSQQGFRGATVRVWTRGRDFQRVLAVRLESPRGATLFLSAELAALRASPAATLFPVMDPAGATGVLLSGETRAARRGVFCQEVQFASGDIAFEVDTCSPDRPAAVDVVLGLARAQAARAAVVS